MNGVAMPGRVVMLNGISSAGKTSLAERFRDDRGRSRSRIAWCRHRWARYDGEVDTTDTGVEELSSQLAAIVDATAR
jgi:chloramphenicol 3-O-phosphotransferase